MAEAKSEASGTRDFIVQAADVRNAVALLKQSTTEAQFMRIRAVCPDWFVEAALYARENSGKDAVKICIRHEEFLTKNGWYDFGVEAINGAIQQGLHKVLPKRDNEGRLVFTFDFPQVNFKAFSVENCQQVAFFLLKNALRDAHTRKYGFTMLVDLRGFTFSVLRSISRRDRSRGIGMIQNCLPVRMKKIVIMNEGWVTRFALRMVMPFVNKKLRKRITYTGKSRDAVLALVPREVLPADIGGAVPRAEWEARWVKTAALALRGDLGVEGMPAAPPVFGGSAVAAEAADSTSLEDTQESPQGKTSRHPSR